VNKIDVNIKKVMERCAATPTETVPRLSAKRWADVDDPADRDQRLVDRADLSTARLSTTFRRRSRYWV
jgi:hypothetical protein